ncbi:MAG: SufD family Fe-S cluster assembly protein [bacterium]
MQENNKTTKTILITNENENIEILKDSIFNYLWIGKDNQKYKGNLTIFHNIANTKSNISIKVVLYDNSSFDLEAIVHISKGAIGTDTYLKVNALILSNYATIKVEPSLEILENDVKAGHSAIIKEIPLNEIYYLMSRGLSEEEAKSIIVEAFINS